MASAIGGIVTIGSTEAVEVIAAGLLGAVSWNLVTWHWGLPSSSWHALVGGLVGAALVAGGAGAVRWGGLDGIHPIGVFGACIALATSAMLAFSHGANDAQKSAGVIAALLLADGQIVRSPPHCGRSSPAPPP